MAILPAILQVSPVHALTGRRFSRSPRGCGRPRPGDAAFSHLISPPMVTPAHGCAGVSAAPSKPVLSSGCSLRILAPLSRFRRKSALHSLPDCGPQEGQLTCYARGSARSVRGASILPWRVHQWHARPAETRSKREPTKSMRSAGGRTAMPKNIGWQPNRN